MTQTIDFELTREGISVLAALIYEPTPRVWIDHRWACPFCLMLNARAHNHCSCGVPRDARTAAASQHAFTHVMDENAWMPDAARAGFSHLGHASAIVL